MNIKHHSITLVWPYKPLPRNIIHAYVTELTDRSDRMNSTLAFILSNSTDNSSAPFLLETFKFVSAGTLGILVALAVVGNILTIAAVVKFRHLWERHCVLITSLAVADALAGVAWGIALVNAVHPLWCFFALDLMLISFPTASSHLHVLLMAIDRLIAIKFPFRYLTWMSERCIKISIACVWIFAFVYALTFLPWALRDTPSKSCSEDGPLTVYVVSMQFITYMVIACSIIIIYSHINRVAKLHINRINTGNPTMEANIMETHTSSHKTPHNSTSSQNMKLPVTPKATKFMLAVIIAYLVLGIPYFVTALAGVINPRWTSTNVVWQVMTRISLYFMVLNSCLNVFIYAAYIKGFREAYKTMLVCSSNY